MRLPIYSYMIKICNGPPGGNATTALMDMYRRLDMMRRMFDWMVVRSSASWTVMVAGLLRVRDLEAGMQLFSEKQPEDGVTPNEITMLSLVIECGLTGALQVGKWLHAYVLRNGFEMKVVLATVLVDIYCKCKETESARALFDTMACREIQP